MAKKAYTAKRFAEDYSQRSGVTITWLKENGLEPRPCFCEEKRCRGWQMAHVEGEDWPTGSEYPRSDPRFHS